MLIIIICVSRKDAKFNAKTLRNALRPYLTLRSLREIFF